MPLAHASQPHARADQVWVTVIEEGDAVEVQVRDDGVGIELERPSAGFGLHGMRERVALAGGTLAFAATNSGTLVQATLPAKRLAATVATAPAQT